MLLVSAGQPLFAEDTWWHLGMGEAYAASGPWLEADPFLYTASGPPAPAAWLSDVALDALARAFGFPGLRVVHMLGVAAILGLAWSCLRRASGSARFASLATALFGALCAYRLFQLRPHLVTIAAALLLYRLLIEGDDPPSRGRVAGAVGLMALWANAHGAFLLGPVLLAAAVAGLGIAARWRPGERARDRARARRLAAALGLGLLATFATPSGLRQHGLYFAAGSGTPALELVADEWSPVHLLELPVPRVPPSPLTWAALWCLLVATPGAVYLQGRARRRERPRATALAPDPALVAMAAASLLGLLWAVRLVWLAIFPLLVVARAGRALGIPRNPSRPSVAWGAALASVLLVPGFARFGDWPMISQGVDRATYARPYPAAKSHAHAVWFLRDAGLEGNLFNDYASGNFLGYWLAPRIRVFVNGSLNVPVDVMRARRAILEHRGSEPGETFLGLLDRYGVDLFFGTGVPAVLSPQRPVISTTAHLEGAPGWIPVFRNLRSAVYLRNAERTRANLERVASYYAREGVPFDPQEGFAVERVVREAPRWAVGHGLLPVNFQRLERAARSMDPSRRAAARERLAALYATLGLYERAVAVDRDRLRENPRSLAAARRLVWSLLHRGREAESLAAAEELAEIAPPQDGLSRLLVDAARRRASLSEDAAASLLAVLPVFTRPQMQTVLSGYREPEARSRAR